jgi:hypothetical protein
MYRFVCYRRLQCPFGRLKLFEVSTPQDLLPENRLATLMVDLFGVKVATATQGLPVHSVPSTAAGGAALHQIFGPHVGDGLSLQIGVRRKSLHVCNAPKATAGGTP